MRVCRITAKLLREFRVDYASFLWIIVALLRGVSLLDSCLLNIIPYVRMFRGIFGG